MTTLALDPICTMPFPPRPLVVVLVGVGGTGSLVAQNLARLAVHLRSLGRTLDLVLMDGDTVEPHNVGRQWFTPRDVGDLKADVVATRLSYAFGLRVQAVTQYANPTRLGGVLRSFGGRECIRLVVGAVDGWAGRNAIHETMRTGSLVDVWIDAGNHEHAGQVLVGTHTVMPSNPITGTLCTALPSPARQIPDLIRPPVMPVVAADSCAVAMADNRQSLMINTLMASIVGEYVTQIATRHALTTFRTDIDALSLSMRSVPITAAALYPFRFPTW